MFLKNYESYLKSKEGGEKNYNQVKDHERRKYSYDYIVSKFNLNNDIKDLFIGCNFKEIFGLYSFTYSKTNYPFYLYQNMITLKMKKQYICLE